MDNLDMRILGRLLNNCRESDRQIGKRLGISGGAVHSRIEKMLKAGTIESFLLKVEPSVLGLGVFYIVVNSRDYNVILEQVKLVGEPFLVVPCIGGVTVCGIAVKDDVQKRIELAKNIMRDVKVLSILEADEPDINSNLTKTDLVVMNELISDPRRMIEVMAKNTGLSTKTITRSIEKLQRNDRMQFTLVYEPTLVDPYIPHAILAWIKGDLEEAVKNLESEFSDNFLQIPFIAKNQIVLFMYSDNIFGVDDLTQRVRDMPNVGAIELFIPKKIRFLQKWTKRAIQDAQKSPTLHLVYQTN